MESDLTKLLISSSIEFLKKKPEIFGPLLSNPSLNSVGQENEL